MDSLADAQFSSTLRTFDQPITPYNVSVQSVTLDEIIKDNDIQNSLLKLDCEGAEYDIIINAIDTLFDKIAIIVAEIHGDILDKNQVDDIIHKLGAFNYDVTLQPDKNNTQILYAIAN